MHMYECFIKHYFRYSDNGMAVDLESPISILHKKTIVVGSSDETPKGDSDGR